jgi:hypothetical protein
MTAKPVWPLWMIINQLEGDDPLNPQIHPWDHPNSTLTLDAQGNAYWVPVITYSMTGIARDHNWVSGTSEYMSQAVPPINDDVSAKIATARPDSAELAADRRPQFGYRLQLHLRPYAQPRHVLSKQCHRGTGGRRRLDS